jgi:methylated-DNA-[protein]-cysteine S-methyltransferase
VKFAEKVYILARKVPKGRVTTYKEIAKKLRTKACRAVGNCLNKNPDTLRTPCHRVVNSDGRVGGYAKGTAKKAEILRKEGIRISRGRIAGFKKALYRFH